MLFSSRAVNEHFYEPSTSQSMFTNQLIGFLLYAFFSTVSAEILKSSLSTMERHIQRLENDIENFPKKDDQEDKFVEKLSISFFMWLFSHYKYTLNVLSHNRTLCVPIVHQQRQRCVLFVFSLAVGKQFKSLGVIGCTQGNLGNASGCFSVRCWSDVPLHSSLRPKSEIMPVAIFCCTLPPLPVPWGTLIGALAPPTNLSPIPDFISWLATSLSTHPYVHYLLSWHIYCFDNRVFHLNPSISAPKLN